MSNSAITTQVAQLKVGNVQNQADSSSVYSAGAWDFKNASAVTSVKIDNSGNVGIGTASPTVPLDVVASNSNAFHLKLRGRASDSVGQMEFWNNANTTRYGFIGADSTSVSINTSGSLPLLFGTNAAERMRIDASGRLSVGNNSASNTIGGLVNIENGGVNSQNGFTYYYNASAPTGSGFYVNSPQAGTATSSWNPFYARVAGLDRFFVIGTGQIYSQFTSILSASDASLKENIRELDTGLSQILALKPRRFDWKEEADVGLKDVAGFIAQEVEEILPELIQEFKYKDDETKKAIKMGDITPHLVKAIQELSAKVDAQAEEIKALKAS